MEDHYYIAGRAPGAAPTAPAQIFYKTSWHADRLLGLLRREYANQIRSDWSFELWIPQDRDDAFLQEEPLANLPTRADQGYDLGETEDMLRKLHDRCRAWEKNLVCPEDWFYVFMGRVDMGFVPRQRRRPLYRIKGKAAAAALAEAMGSRFNVPLETDYCETIGTMPRSRVEDHSAWDIELERLERQCRVEPVTGDARIYAACKE
jgi:hypothetical protein